MSSFTSPLIVSPIDSRKWKLIEEFDYHVGNELSPDVIHVPAGFITDFASVPRGMWNLFPPWGRYGKAAIIHDFLYQSKLRSRHMSDLIFLEAMIVLKVAKWQATLMYYGVRMFGWLGYKNNNLKKYGNWTT